MIREADYEEKSSAEGVVARENIPIDKNASTLPQKRIPPLPS
jgi:hypothetical protein